jgi:nucleotide-binding universal stress UspA family protein
MFDTIVIAAHRTTAGRAAANQGLELARAVDADVHLVCAYPGAGDRSQAEDLLDGLTLSGVVPATTHAIPGEAADALLQVAHEVGADLIVVGNKGMHGPRRLLGSVPSAVAHRAGCAVMILSSPEA